METLDLQPIAVGSDWLEALARGLAGNKSVRSLFLSDLEGAFRQLLGTVPIGISNDTSAGWVAISTALCDTSSVNSTYLSNHTICGICERHERQIDLPQDIPLYLRLNGAHSEHAAR